MKAHAGHQDWRYRTGLMTLEPSLLRHNADIENLRPETGVGNGSIEPKSRATCTTETGSPHANCRMYRTYFCGSDMAARDRTDWLGYQDSNLEMANPKMPFDSSARLPLILERFGTEDFSPPGCAKLRIHLPGALAALGARIRTGLERGFWKPGAQPMFASPPTADIGPALRNVR
jgi:hypothetical protein